MSNRLGGKQGTSYLGTNANQPPNWTFSHRPPTEYDTQNVSIGDLWFDDSATGVNTVWVLVSLAGNSTSKGPLAYWVQFGTASISITGDTGGALFGNSFTFTGGTTGLSFNGGNMPNTETLQFAGITANGGPVNLSTDNINGTVSIGTGTANKTVQIGSESGTSSLDLKTGAGGFNLASASGAIINAQSTGEINYPLQPAFVAKTSVTIQCYR